jgi:thiol-disulfide isomerase/thioredoxin
MKKVVFRFCLLAGIAFFCVACTNRISDKEFLIEGKISGVEDGTVINLSRWDENVGKTLATDTVRNGRFTIKAEALPEPERLTITVRGNDFPPMFLYVWVAPGEKVKIQGIGKIHPLWDVKSSITFQKEENRYIKNKRDLIAENSRIRVERSKAFEKIMTASSRDEAAPFSKIVDSLDMMSKPLSVKETYSDVDIMEKTDISPVWLEKLKLTTYYAKDDENLRKRVEKLYGRMSEEDKNTLIGFQITAELFPPAVVGVGDDMADTDLIDMNGNTKHLSDYLGKYLLLDFWSSGCGPCIMALPEMKEISENYNENLTIISITLDSDTRWKEAMDTHDMPWVNIRDPKSFGGLSANYGVRGIPYYVMVSPEGKIVDKWGGYGQGSLKRKLSEIVK